MLASSPPRSPLRREVILSLLADERRPMHVNEIETRLDLDAGGCIALQRLLDDLSFDGSVVPLAGHRFRLGNAQTEEHGKTADGTLNVNPRGFGFVQGTGLDADVYVPPEAMGGALHGDAVEVRIVSRSRRGVEGVILRVRKRRMARVAGTLRIKGKSAWLEPDDARIRGPIVLKRISGEKANDGDAAVVKITRFPELPEENPEGELEVVLGEPGDPKVEVLKILLREGIEEPHPADAVAEAEAYGTEVAPEALVGREDLTGIPLPTIDPEDARDHDDAVWVVRNKEDGSYRAWIAIADVSTYVKPGTALDRTALSRGNSIYLPDRAIPMLPRALSSNLCSLLPGVIRLCLCVIVDLTAAGVVTESRVVEGFMRSAAKLTYPGVARALGFTTLPEVSPEAEAMKADLTVMWDLATILRAHRMRRGALDFDLPEAKVILDPTTGAPVDVKKRTHDPGVSKAYNLIEEMMLLANETCARYLVERDVPAIFRFHGTPDEAKLDRFSTLCGELGVKFETADALDPKKLSVFLKKISAHPMKQVLHMLLLRAMRQAVYSVDNAAHFGLASVAYLHFTSPIRRYPDIIVHRGLRAVLHNEPVDRSDAAMETLRAAASTASECERKGMEVEREVMDLHRALLMRDKVGSIYEGRVTSLVGSGVFVNVDDPFIDVLVRMESLGPDSYALDDEALRIIGQRSGDRIALGDPMMVIIEDVSILRRTIYGRRMLAPDERLEQKRDRKVKRSGETMPEGRGKGAKGPGAAKSGKGAKSAKPFKGKKVSKPPKAAKGPKGPKVKNAQKTKKVKKSKKGKRG
jgi:ribonuclease R